MQRSKCAVVIAVLLGVILLAGCGAVGYHSGELGKGWSTARVPYKGFYIDCVFYESGSGNNAIGGPSCDFVEYHRRNR